MVVLELTRKEAEMLLNAIDDEMDLIKMDIDRATSIPSVDKDHMIRDLALLAKIKRMIKEQGIL